MASENLTSAFSSGRLKTERFCVTADTGSFKNAQCYKPSVLNIGQKLEELHLLLMLLQYEWKIPGEIWCNTNNKTNKPGPLLLIFFSSYPFIVSQDNVKLQDNGPYILKNFSFRPSNGHTIAHKYFAQVR
jgi:hypothetical protein